MDRYRFDADSVADPGCLSRIRIFSRLRIQDQKDLEFLLIPDPGVKNKAPDPGSGSATLDADLDSDPNFHFWRRSVIRTGIKTILIHMRIIPKFCNGWKIGLKNNFTCIHSNGNLQCFSFLISGKCVMIESKVYFFSILKSRLPDPDRYAWMPISIPIDPAKWCGSDPIRIHNTGSAPSWCLPVPDLIIRFSTL